MKLLEKNIHWIMIVTGLMTCIMFVAALSPDTFLRLAFGTTLEGPVAQIVVRNWGALLGMSGLLLIYAGMHATYRRLALVFASVSKVLFVALILAYGQAQGLALMFVLADVAMVVLYVAYLMTASE